MSKTLNRIFNSRAYKFLNHASNIKFAISVIVAMITWITSKMHGKPLELIIVYVSVSSAATLYLVDQIVKLYQNYIHGEEPKRQPGRPNIVLSYCRLAELNVPQVGDEGPEIMGGVVATFYNDASSPEDAARGVVAHLAYFKEPPVHQEMGDSIWKTTQGLWDPGHEQACDFEINASGRLVLAAIIREETSYRSEPAIFAVGYRPLTLENPQGLEIFPLQENLPVVVRVDLRGRGFLRKFAFRLSKVERSFNCDELPTLS